jgi:hypothetical protein
MPVGAAPPSADRLGRVRSGLVAAVTVLADTFTLGTLFLLWLALSGIPLRRVWDAWYAWALIAAATGASVYLSHPFEGTAQRTSAFRSSLAPGSTGEVEVAGFVDEAAGLAGRTVSGADGPSAGARAGALDHRPTKERQRRYRHYGPPARTRPRTRGRAAGGCALGPS